MIDLEHLELVPDAKGPEGMLTVDHSELIRRKVIIEGLSQREAAKELGHSRRTVAKALEPNVQSWCTFWCTRVTRTIHCHHTPI